MPEPASGKRRGTPLAPPLQNMTSSPRGARAHGAATKRGDLGPAAGDLDSTMLDRDPARCSLSSLMAGLGCCCDEETTTTTTPATALQPKAQPAPALLSPSLNQKKKTPHQARRQDPQLVEAPLVGDLLHVKSEFVGDAGAISHLTPDE